jgi:5-methyltetrahydrofolate--homocysteine methyltransferase
MDALLQRIHRGEIIVADGAMGTLLIQKGFRPEDCFEVLNLKHPDVIREISSAYRAAGAEIIQTNTFGASPLKLQRFSLDGETEAINAKAVEIAREAASDGAYISGSCGPSGKMLIPYGDTSPEQIYESALRQTRALIAAGVDIICVETMTDLTEAILTVKAAKAVSPAIPVIATMTFDLTPRGFFTIMGVTIEQAAKELEQAGADIIGANCGHGIEQMINIARQFRASGNLPFIIQSNAGLPELIDGVPTYCETPEFMADKSRELVAAGVSIIGGCCGTTPAHIAAIRRMVDGIGRKIKT